MGACPPQTPRANARSPLRLASRSRLRRRRFDVSNCSRSSGVKPARAGSRRHQHSKPQRRSSPTRSRGIPPPLRRGSPVSKSKKPSNTAAAPVRSGSPSRQSRRITHGVPGRISSRARCGRRPRSPRGCGARPAGRRSDRCSVRRSGPRAGAGVEVGRGSAFGRRVRNRRRRGRSCTR